MMSNLKDLTSISLSNVVYKTVAKYLGNRFRSLLQDIISDTQSAFILGRMITDNDIIVFECFHALQKVSKTPRKFLHLQSRPYEGLRQEQYGLCRTMDKVDHGVCQDYPIISEIQWQAAR
jgi:hypothetical protein